MKNNGWVKLHRKTMESSVFKNSNYFKVWMWCLMKANHEEHTFPFNGKDLLIKDGEFITGRPSACEELFLTEQNYRSAIKYLKSTNRITIKPSNKFSLIKVNKWEEYQSVTSKVTNKQPTTNQQLTTYKNDKKEKKLTQFSTASKNKSMKYEEEVITLDANGEEIETPTPHSGKFGKYTREVATHYADKQNLVVTGQTMGEAKKLLAFILKEHPELDNAKLAKEAKAGINLTAKLYSDKGVEEWGLTKVIANWNKII